MEKIFGMDFGEADVIALGIPLGKNSEKVLNFLRKTSLFLETFDVDRKKGISLRVCDKGNLKIKDSAEITNEVKKIVEIEKIPLILSKSHLASLFSVQAFEKKLKLIVFDAHADLRDRYLDEKVKSSSYPIWKKNERYNCATWLRRLLEKGYENVAIIGLRACSEEELELIEKKFFYLTSNQIKEDLRSCRRKLKKFVKNSEVYLSLDMDFFDPSIAPAVEHPEPNGLSFQEFLSLIEELSKARVAGLDLTEVCFAEKKLMEITCFLASKCIFEILSRIKN